MRPLAVQAGKLLVLAALGAFPFVVHAGLMMGQATPYAAVLSMVQLVAIGVFVVVLFVAHHRWLAVATAAGLGLVALWARSAQLGAVAAAGTVHAVVYIALLAAFGLTLLPGRVALVTALARKIHGAIPDDMAVYTRGVTWAWCGFFAAQLVGSLTLLLFAPLVVWSLFVNVLNFPLIVLMFAAESCYRVVGLKNRPRYGLADMMVIWAYIKASLSTETKSG
jgi:uncharacterized membrane protein